MMRKMRYTKDNGDVSERLVLVMSKPQKNYLTIDFSEWEPEDVSEFMDQLNELDKQRSMLLEAANVKWRNFKPENIEWID